MQLLITIDQVRYRNAESGWCLLKATMGGDGQPETSVICKGTLAWPPEPLETLVLTGEWVTYKGERQFQFRGAKLSLPLDPRGQLHYVCVRSKGIGASIEQQIWDLKKENWRELERGAIRKISNSTFDSFLEQVKLFDLNHEKAEIISWLLDKGCSDTMAEAAYEKWGADTLGIVNQNCYMLADLPGFSFKTVDENVRRNFDIADDDQRRVKAAILYALETEDGSTAVDCWAHFDTVQKLIPNVGDILIKKCVSEMAAAGEIHIFVEQIAMASRRDYLHELTINAYMQRALNAPEETCISTDAELSAGEPFTPDASQLDAVRYAITHKAAIINGGAGVGKTTVIKMIVRGLKAAHPTETVKLCAPTGKAAARLKEASKIEATTIHVLLGARGNNTFSDETLENRAVIIDESSMVDSALMAELVKRKPARLILVGDQAQLTPVGKGQPFHDLIDLYPNAVRTLTKCYRNREAVFQAAIKIRNGNMPPRSMETEKEKWTICGAASPDDAHEMICAWARDGLLDFEKDIVLCPKNGKRLESGLFQPATVNALNDDLLAIDRERRGVIDEGKFQPGDRVINTVNDPANHVWNGTTGTVRAKDDEGGVFVRLDVPFIDETGELKDTVRFTREMAKNLCYAYALTVHKSQGSQYRKVVMAILPRDAFQLERSLIYTAVTRTKGECVIVGDYGTFAKGISTVRMKRTVLKMLNTKTEANT